MNKSFVSLLLGFLVMFGNYPVLQAGQLQGPADAIVVVILAFLASQKKKSLGEGFVEKMTHCKKEWSDFIKVRYDFEELNMIRPVEGTLNPNGAGLEEVKSNQAILQQKKDEAEKKLNICMMQLPRKKRLHDNALYQLLKAQETPLNASLRLLLSYITLRLIIKPIKQQ